MTEPVGKPRAIDTAGIGPKFARARRRAIALTVIGAIGLIGSIVTWRVLDRMYLARQDDLVASLGRIEEVREHDDRPDEVVVSFTWGGEPKTATVQVGKHRGYDDGQGVTVLSSADGDTVTLPGENYFPQGIELLCVVGGGIGAVLLVAGTVWWVRSQRKLRRTGASSWRTVVAYYADSRGEDGYKTVFYVPEFATDRFWVTSDRVPMAPTRVEVAGGPTGIVLRVAEDAKLVLAKPEAVGPPRTARLWAYAENDVDVGLSVEVDQTTRILAGRRRYLPIDVEDLAGVHVATIRFGRHGVALVQLGSSLPPTPFRRVPGGEARKEWPQLARW